MEVTHERTIIRYSVTNEKIITGFEEFQAKLEKAKANLLEGRAEGVVMTEVEIEALGMRLRGDAQKREDVMMQNSTIIQMIMYNSSCGHCVESSPGGRCARLK